jgi:hypothetical protein
MTIFTLQVNDSGAWRNVVSGNDIQIQSIETHAAQIAFFAGSRYKWRIVEKGSMRVIGYCRAPDYTWRPPQ